jgi:hypothetical protein
MATAKTLRTCSREHKYYKRTDCPTCPICEAERKPGDGFLTLLSAPACRALENKNISTEKQVSRFTAKEFFHCMVLGPVQFRCLKKF